MLDTAQTAIRPYQPADLASVVNLWYDTWRATVPDLQHRESRLEWRQRFEQQIAAQEQEFVAHVAGQLAGFLAVRAYRGLLAMAERLRVTIWPSHPLN